MMCAYTDHAGVPAEHGRSEETAPRCFRLFGRQDQVGCYAPLQLHIAQEPGAGGDYAGPQEVEKGEGAAEVARYGGRGAHMCVCVCRSMPSRSMVVMIHCCWAQWVVVEKGNGMACFVHMVYLRVCVRVCHATGVKGGGCTHCIACQCHETI